MLLFCLCANAASNSLSWRTNNVTADVRNLPLSQLLPQIATQTGWRVYVEPGATHDTSAKFKNESTGIALKMLLGDLNFALVPQTNGPSQLYVFRTAMKNATHLVKITKVVGKHIANELLVRVKPGTDIDALAKSVGAKVTGRDDKNGIYRLQFDNAAATDSALADLQNNPNVLEVDYNYVYEPPPSAQLVSSAPLGPVSLTLDPPSQNDPCNVTIGLIDTPVQSLGQNLNPFLLNPVSVVSNSAALNSSDPTHGTAMAQTILRAVSQSSGGNSSARILPVDVYGSGETTTSWYVALGVQAAVNNGANVINLSLAGSGDSAILDGVIQDAMSSGIVFFAAAGNTPVNTPTYPAAISGVNAVTALQQQGQLASYANYGSFVDMALPGSSVVYMGNQAYLVQGTSVSTAYATGVAAGTKTSNCSGWPQIQAAMQQKFTVPQGN